VPFADAMLGLRWTDGRERAGLPTSLSSLPIFLCSGSSCSQFLLGHHCTLFFVIARLFFPLDSIFNVTGAMMMAVFFPPAVIIGISEELK